MTWRKASMGLGMVVFLAVAFVAGRSSSPCLCNEISTTLAYVDNLKDQALDTCLDSLDLSHAIMANKERDIEAVASAYRCLQNPVMCPVIDDGTAIGGDGGF